MLRATALVAAAIDAAAPILVRWHAHQRLAVEHDLVTDAARAGEARAPPLRGELGDRNGDVDRVADAHRGAEVQGLRDVDRTRPGQARAEHGRDQAGGVEAV